MNTIIHNGYIIDEERDDFTKKPIFTVWDKKGVLWLKTCDSLEEAKKYAENKPSVNRKEK